MSSSSANPQGTSGWLPPPKPSQLAAQLEEDMDGAEVVDGFG